MAEVLHGYASADLLNARADKSQVYGLKGNDTLTSDNKSDVLLVGGSGSDSLIISGGNGTLSGGEGSDTFELTYSADKKLSAVIEDLIPTEDKIVVNFDGDTPPQISTTTSGLDVVLRDNSGNLNVTLKGVRDNDYFDGDTDEKVWTILEMTNVVREYFDKSPLTMSDGLTEGAEIRVQEITKKGNLGLLEDHTRLDNKTSWLTVFDEIGKFYVDVGENLDGGARFPIDVMNDWLGSIAHREHIVKDTYKKIGIAYNEDDPDPSNLRFYWTQWFAAGLSSTEKVTVSTANLLTATPEVNTVSKFIQGDDEPNTISNGEYSATIDAKGGGDFVTNSGLLASISGGNDNDTLNNSGSFATINAGTGDDQISLGTDAKEVLLEYLSGDGNDIIIGIGNNDTLSILDNEFTPAVVGDELLITVGTDLITIKDASKATDFEVKGMRSNLIILTENDDSHDNYDENATIMALGGDDTVNNIEADNVTILGGAGDDYIYNGSSIMGLKFFEEGNSLFIDGGAGDDFIGNYGSNVTIKGGAGDDYINNYGSDATIDASEGNNDIANIGDNVSIETGDGNDSIQSYGSNVTISAGTGNDSIYNGGGDNVSIETDAGDDVITNGNPDAPNSCSNVTIDAGTGNDTINTWGNALSIKGGDGNESIRNWEGDSLTIDGGAGNDSIDNSGKYASIVGGSGNDTITSSGESGTINGGSGNDWISNYSSGTTVFGGAGNDYIYNYSDNVLFIYTAGDGNDFVDGFNATSTLQIGDGSDTYSTVISEDGNDVVVKVGRGYVTLRGAASLGSSLNIRGTEREPVEKDNTITLTEGDDTYSNTLEGASIQALGGNDSIDNAGDNVTINGGLGDDTISFADAAQNNVVEYAPGDGNDIVLGFKENDTLRIASDRYTRSTLDNALVIGVGTGSVTLADAATLPAVNVIPKWSESGEGNNLITLTEGNDCYNNSFDSATIQALGGNDTIYNDSANVAISGNNGDDSIHNFPTGVRASISGGAGNDSIRNYPYADFATIDGGSGDDSIVNDGANVSVNAGAGNDYIENWESEATIAGGDGDDTIDNYFGNSAMIDGGSGNDSIRNRATENVTMFGGSGNDFIGNSGLNVTIDGGAGNDSLYNHTESENVLMLGGDGDDTVENWGKDTAILGGAGDDAISNYATNVTIDGEAGADFIINHGENVTLDGGDGSDTITNSGENVSITGGDDDDTITNNGDNATISGDDGNDYISNYNADVSMLGGAGNDTIFNSGDNATIEGGAGDDRISNVYGDNILFNYTEGDGDDTIYGFSGNATINIVSEEDYSETVEGDDVIIYVGTGSMRLVDAREQPVHVIIGESGTSGGGSGSGDGGSSSGGNGGRGGNDGGKTSGGTSSNEGLNSDASGNKSAIGSRGRSNSTNTNTGGGTVRGTSRNSRLNLTTPVEHVEFPNILKPSAQQTTATTQPTANQRIYNGGNQVISDYQSGEKIIFAEVYTGSFYDAERNYCVGSSTGALVIQNASDKVIDLSDSAGNSVIKAYAASSAGVIDGRGLAGFEIINGSAGADAIFAGDGGSQLWGGADFASDTLIGGGGTDIFIGGRTQGADIVLNASSTDIVHLNDATLSDIIATEENNGVIAVAFNTGNVIAVDGSIYRFNHVTKNWQTT